MCKEERWCVGLESVKESNEKKGKDMVRPTQ